MSTRQWIDIGALAHVPVRGSRVVKTSRGDHISARFVIMGNGVAIGLGFAGLGMPVARTLLYGVSPFDPISFGSVTAFLLAAAFVASYLPALRATRVDPVVALRGE